MRRRIGAALLLLALAVLPAAGVASGRLVPVWFIHHPVAAAHDVQAIWRGVDALVQMAAR